MQFTTITAQSSYKIACSTLPLVVYRELEAHLRQVSGVDVALLPQQVAQFDYALSQVGGLHLWFTADANLDSRRRVDQILAYYSDRYGQWQILTD
jgi:hypothetical protein